MTADLSPAEAATVARFDAALPLPEVSPLVRAVLGLAAELERQAADMELVRADEVAAKPTDPATRYADAVARNVGKEWVKLAARLRAVVSQVLAGLPDPAAPVANAWNWGGTDMTPQR